MLNKKQATYNIKYDTEESYNGNNYISIDVYIDYERKFYNIKLSELNIIGDNKLPLHFSKCLEKVYDFVIFELYHNVEEHVYYDYKNTLIKLGNNIKIDGYYGTVIFKDKQYYVDFNVKKVLLKSINKEKIQLISTQLF